MQNISNVRNTTLPSEKKHLHIHTVRLRKKLYHKTQEFRSLYNMNLLYILKQKHASV